MPKNVLGAAKCFFPGMFKSNVVSKSETLCYVLLQPEQHCLHFPCCLTSSFSSALTGYYGCLTVQKEKAEEGFIHSLSSVGLKVALKKKKSTVKTVQ